MIKRAFGAASFAEEKRLLVGRARALVESGFDWDASQEFATEFGSASLAARSHRATVLAAVSVQGLLLEHCSSDLTDDLGVVLAAVTSHGRALKHASRALRSDREVVLRAVQQRGLALMFAGPELASDPEIVLQAVTMDGETLKYASSELRGQKDIVLAAVGSFPWALAEASDELMGDKDIMMKALQRQAKDRARARQARQRGKVQQGPGPGHSVLRCGSESLRADREVLIEALKASWQDLGLASPELKSDKDLVLLAVRLAPVDERMACWFKADEELRRGLAWPDFDAAAESLLACPGETAPILMVRLQERDAKLQESCRSSSIQSFSCEATLLTGKSFTCSLSKGRPDDSNSNVADDNDETETGTEATTTASLTSEDCHEDEDTDFRPYLILNDLANKLLDELPRHTEVGRPERLFIIFANDGGDAAPVAAWEWSRPLAYYACAS